jgi:hypothetical protein
MTILCPTQPISLSLPLSVIQVIRWGILYNVSATNNEAIAWSRCCNRRMTAGDFTFTVPVTGWIGIGLGCVSDCYVLKTIKTFIIAANLSRNTEVANRNTSLKWRLSQWANGLFAGYLLPEPLRQHLLLIFLMIQRSYRKIGYSFSAQGHGDTAGQYLSICWFRSMWLSALVTVGITCSVRSTLLIRRSLELTTSLFKKLQWITGRRVEWCLFLILQLVMTLRYKKPQCISTHRRTRQRYAANINFGGGFQMRSTWVMVTDVRRTVVLLVGQSNINATPLDRFIRHVDKDFSL